MKRNNAAVKIPPNPPKSSIATYKPVQIGVPPTAGSPSSPSRPSKPRRGVPKSDTSSTSQFFYSQDTLSDVQITFSKPESDQNQTLCTAGEWKGQAELTTSSSNPAAQPFYENLSRNISTKPIDIEESEIVSYPTALQLVPGVEVATQSVRIEPASESTPSQPSHAKLRQCDTFDNLLIGKMSAPLYENVNRKAGRKGTYLVPDELLSVGNGGIDSHTSTASPNPTGCTAQVRVEVEPDPAEQTSIRSSQSISSNGAQLRPPAPYLANTIYKDPLSLFESTEPGMLSVGGQQFSAVRSKSTSNLSDSSGSRATTIQDSGSEVSTVDRNSEISRVNTFEDFVVLRRIKGEGKGARQRAVSELITNDELRNSNRQAGWFEALKQSFFGSNSFDSTHNCKRPTSTFYVDQVDADDEVLYSSLDIPEPRNISSRVRRKLPESLVTKLTPAVFELPQDLSSVFYTDQEEHIYSSSETLGSLSYPEVSVQNLGYRDPQVRAAEQLEQSIPVRNSRSQSEGGILSEASTHAAVRGDTSDATSGATSAATRARTYDIKSGYEDLGKCKSENGFKKGQQETAGTTLNVEKSSFSSNTTEKGESEVFKMKVSRVSMMKQKFERPSSDESSSDENKVVLRNKTDADKLVRKQIVSQQFSSNVLEIQHKMELISKSHVNDSNGR